MTRIADKIRKLRHLLRTQLIEAYSTGLFSHEEMVKVTGCQYATVVNFYNTWKDRYSFPSPKRGNVGRPKKIRSKLRNDIDRAYKLYLGGMSMAEVGRRYDVSREYVRQIFVRQKLEIRPRDKRKIK